MADWIVLRRADGVSLRVGGYDQRCLPSYHALSPLVVQVRHQSELEAFSSSAYKAFIFSMRYYGRWLAYDKSEQDTK